MFTLRRIPYLDQQTKNYLNLIQVEPTPETEPISLQVKTVNPPQLSPFSVNGNGNNCCVSVMTRELNTETSCGYAKDIVQTYGTTNQYLQSSELETAIRAWINAGYTVNADLTKIMKKEDPNVLIVFMG